MINFLKWLLWVESNHHLTPYEGGILTIRPQSILSLYGYLSYRGSLIGNLYGSIVVLFPLTKSSCIRTKEAPRKEPLKRLSLSARMVTEI